MKESNTIDILLVDDHQLILDGLKELLQTGNESFEVRTSNSALEALRMLSQGKKPYIIFSDLDMPEMSGKEFCKLVKFKYPECKFLVLSMHGEKYLIKDLLDSGADGYLSKSCGQHELFAAINAVLNGRKFYTAEIIESLMSEPQTNNKNSLLLKHLSQREIEILKHTGNGKSSKQIGDSLHISHRTVEAHRNNLMKKLEVKHVAGLIKIAIKTGLVE